MSAPDSLKGRDFTSIRGWARAELETVLELAGELKATRLSGGPTALAKARIEAENRLHAQKALLALMVP